MPTVHLAGGYKFLFYSLDEGEPPHVHVSKNRKQAKFWLIDGALAKNKGFKEHELNEIRSIIRVMKDAFLRAWNDHFGA